MPWSPVPQNMYWGSPSGLFCLGNPEIHTSTWPWSILKGIQAWIPFKRDPGLRCIFPGFLFCSGLNRTPPLNVWRIHFQRPLPSPTHVPRFTLRQGLCRIYLRDYMPDESCIMLHCFRLQSVAIIGDLALHVQPSYMILILSLIYAHAISLRTKTHSDSCTRDLAENWQSTHF